MTENQTQEQNQVPILEARQGSIHPNTGQFLPGPYVQWVPIQVQPLPSQTNQLNPAQSSTGFPERANDEDPQLNNQSNSGGTGWPFLNQTGSGSSGFGASPYPTYGPGFLPFAGFTGTRPEPGDPLYTSNADGPELRLITQQLSGLENYSIWSREFRRARFAAKSLPWNPYPRSAGFISSRFRKSRKA